MNTNKKSIKREMVAFAIPLIFMYIINQAYSLIDSMVVARYVDESALAILSATMSIIGVGFSLTSGIGSAASLLVSRAVGEKNYYKISGIIKDALKIGLVLSFILVIIYFVGGNFILNIINIPNEIHDETLMLVYIYTISIILGIICSVVHSSLSGLGESKKPTIYIVFTQVLNIILDIIVVKYFHWGVNGAAFASIVSQFISILLLLSLLQKKLLLLGVNIKQRPKQSYLSDVLYLGVPCLLQQSVMSVGALFINSYVNAFGVAYMSGFSAVNLIGSMMLVPLISITVTLEIYASTSIGAKDIQQLHMVIGFLFPIGVIFVVLVIIMSLSLKEGFISLFLEQPSSESFAFASQYMIYYSFSYIFIYIKYFFDSLFKANHKVFLFVLTSLSALGTRILLTYALSSTFGIQSVIVGTFFSNLIAMFVAAMIYRLISKKLHNHLTQIA